jgi:hypothetical protein
MTPEERRDHYVHIEDALGQCKDICGHDGKRQNILMAYNRTLALARDEIKDIDDYFRDKPKDPMM